MARQRRPRRRTARPVRDNAFINIPYDRMYEAMYVAFIAGLSAFGLIPRATVEIPGRARRLDRIVGLLRRCRYSFHDLSRVGIDRGPPPTPRFNMPFELGLAVALEGAGASARLVRLRGAGVQRTGRGRPRQRRESGPLIEASPGRIATRATASLSPLSSACLFRERGDDLVPRLRRVNRLLGGACGEVSNTGARASRP